MKTLMRSIHLKLYNFSELPEQIEDRKSFKDDFTGYYIKRLDENKLVDATQEMRESLVPEKETKMVKEIVEKFIFDTDSKHTEQVDLCLALKALPARVD